MARRSTAVWLQLKEWCAAARSAMAVAPTRSQPPSPGCTRVLHSKCIATRLAHTHTYTHTWVLQVARQTAVLKENKKKGSDRGRGGVLRFVGMLASPSCTTHAHTHTHTHTHIHMFTHMHTHKHTQAHAHTHPHYKSRIKSAVLGSEFLEAVFLSNVMIPVVILLHFPLVLLIF